MLNVQPQGSLPNSNNILCLWPFQAHSASNSPTNFTVKTTLLRSQSRREHGLKGLVCLLLIKALFGCESLYPPEGVHRLVTCLLCKPEYPRSHWKGGGVVEAVLARHPSAEEAKVGGSFRHTG